MSFVPGKPAIFFMLNYGSSIRNIVAGGVITRLLEHYNIVFLGVGERDRADIEGRLSGGYVIEDMGETPYRGPIRWLQRLRTYIWRHLTSYTELMASYGMVPTWRVKLQFRLGRLLEPLPRAIWSWANKRLAKWPKGDELIAKYRPLAVITSNPLDPDSCVIEYCRAHGIYTACVLESWDNLTNRGALYALPDDLLVWNELLAGQAIKYHMYPPAKVHVTGIPSFDLYAYPERYPSEAHWRAENGLPPSGPVIAYSLSSKHIHGNEDLVVRHLVEARSHGLLPADASILVRFHPRDYDKVVGCYEKIDGVVLQYPNKAFSHRVNDNSISGSGPEMLAATMRYSAVVVNVFSTLCVEAMCNDTPVVVVNYDASDKPMRVSVRRYLKFEHIKDMLSFNAVDVANSPDDLVRMIAAALADPQAKAAERQRCVAAETFGLDGKAAERTAAQLHALISAHAV